ncbi:MAG: helix-turn-helix domain-containing protein [bacterium]
MNKKYIVRLTDGERQQLKELISKGKTATQKIKHANILLKIDADGEAWTDEKAADAFSVHVNTVCSIRHRFVEKGLDAALERKKQCHPSRKRRLLDGEKEAKLIALSCSKAPEGCERWTLHLLADKLVELNIVESISHETVRQALKKRTQAAPKEMLVHST